MRILNFFKKPNGAAYLFILPAVLTLFIFVIIPLAMAVYISFHDMTIYLDSFKFVGLGNYLSIPADSRFWNALKNTIVFLVFEMPVQIVLGLLVAVALSKTTLFSKFMRSVFFLPTVCSLTAISIVWSFLLDPDIGIISYTMTRLGLPKLEYFHDMHMAMALVIIITIWKNFGMTMIIFVGGLQGISQSYYEASEIDGASKIAQFFKITIPMLVPTIGFCVITNTIGSLQAFDQIYVLTSGGPLYSTETLVMYIYDIGFKSDPFNISYASAIAVVLFILILVITLLLNKFISSKETVDV